jgi:hypothetical protein
MQNIARMLMVIAIGAVSWTAGCSRCGEEVPRAEETVGSKQLPWERIELGSNESGFRKALVELTELPVERAAASIDCKDQFTMHVIDSEERTITERSGRGRELVNCTMLRAGSHRSWDLRSARGEFVDGKLMRLTFTFPENRFAALDEEIGARFGPGAETVLEERSAVLLDAEDRRSRLWRRDRELLALVQGVREVRIVRQDASLAGLLPPMPRAAERGEPVNLDDIGLGGGLDLDAALPDVEDLIGGDH